MNPSSRRDFLQTTTALLALGLTSSAFNFSKGKPLLCFTTLGCPDWAFPDIVKFAVSNHYNGLEFRGIQRELDLPKCKEFNTKENILATRKLMDDNNLKFVNLGSSAQLHHRDATVRQGHLDAAKRFIDLAQELKCPYVRVFPNDLPKDQDRAATMELIAKGLIQLGDYTKGGSVKIVLETHGDLSRSADVENVMKLAAHERVGLIWDVVNMWSVTKEPPAEVYQKLKKYVWHTHIKDEKTVDGKLRYVLLGEGETPIFEAMDILYKGGYSGYYSFEWEKLWHPEIEAPEIALAHFPKVMGKHFN